MVVPRVSFLRKAASKQSRAKYSSSQPSQDLDAEYSFIEMRPLAGIKNAADRVREQERAQMDQRGGSEFTVENAVLPNAVG